MLYAAEIWGWNEAECLEKLQVKYIKWILGLDFNTLTHIVLEETKAEMIRIKAGKRAVKYEESTRKKKTNKIIQEVWREIDTKNERKLSKWEETRKKYYEEKGMDRQDLLERWTGDQALAEELAQMDRAEESQVQYDRIVNGRYNKKI
ncbi:hypothetical protein RF55_2615 [Lasius niger]|uniref:Uncharacterized protein n=1 Tax=Lasius niger TaxID=67767 RepID=A0A0J7L2S6_LASNI|nr:hypothetical protein RF55_2615 [Lasius niger]